MKTFSPSEAAFEGFRLIRQRPLSVFAWGLVFVLFFAVLIGLFWLALGPSLQQAIVQGVHDQGAAGMNNFRFNFGSGPAAILINCAIFRAVLRPNERSFASLRISGDEGRVFVVALVLGLIGIGVAILAALVVVLPLVVLFNSGVANAHLITALLGVALAILAFCLLFWVGVRLCLATVITFAERRLAFFDSWRLTRGNFWNLIGSFLLAWLLGSITAFGILLATGIVCLLTLSPVLGNLMSGAPDYARDMPFLIGAGAFGVIGLIFITAVQHVVLVAPLAYVYRALTTGDDAGVDDYRRPSGPGMLVL